MRRNKAQVLSALNLKSAYYQLGLTEQASHKTTFITYLRLPQGHSQSLYIMQLTLNKLFRNQINSYLLVYLDDVICVSESADKHLEHLRNIFKKFREANVKLHPNDCKFFQSKV